MTVARTAARHDPIELVREILAAAWAHPALGRGSLYRRARGDERRRRAVTARVTITRARFGDRRAAASPTTARASERTDRRTAARWAAPAVRQRRRRYGVTSDGARFRAGAHLRADSCRRRVSSTSSSTPLPAVVPEIVVTASRYELLRELVTAPFYVDQRAIEQRPDFGDDPLRALHRLPGAAAGVSAKAHMRGSELNDTAVVLNGQRLLDPFHIRDYQNMFSAIDARAIDGMEVYTGGFPVRYGNRIGALVLVDALDPQSTRHNEVGLSVFNTSVLSAGTIGDGTGSWLVSARRSNLEDVVHERLGEPAYYDFFGEIGVNFSARTHVSVNALTARDRVLLVTEADPTELEQSVKRHAQQPLLGSLATAMVERLASSTTFTSSAFHSTRRASTNDPEKIVAVVRDRARRHDRRRAPGLAARRWATRTRFRGAPSINAAARLRLHRRADYFGFFLTFPDVPATLRRNATLVTGRRVVRGAYFADRWQITPCDDGGARPAVGSSTPISTRRRSGIRVRASACDTSSTADTALRWSLGRYFQSQGLHELQVEDGVSEFHTGAARRPRRDRRWTIGSANAISFGPRPTGSRFAGCGRASRTFRSARDLSRARARSRRGSHRTSGTARGLEVSVAYAEPDGAALVGKLRARARDDRVEGEIVPRSWDQRDAAQAGVAAQWASGISAPCSAITAAGRPRVSTLEESPASEYGDHRTSERAASRRIREPRLRASRTCRCASARSTSSSSIERDQSRQSVLRRLRPRGRRHGAFLEQKTETVAAAARDVRSPLAVLIARRRDQFRSSMHLIGITPTLRRKSCCAQLWTAGCCSRRPLPQADPRRSTPGGAFRPRVSAASIVLGKGTPANDMIGEGLVGRWRLNDEWLLGIAFDQRTFDYETPNSALGIAAASVVDGINDGSRSSAFAERRFDGDGVGIGTGSRVSASASVDADRNVAGTRAGGGTFDIATSADDELHVFAGGGLHRRARAALVARYVADARAPRHELSAHRPLPARAARSARTQSTASRSA